MLPGEAGCEELACPAGSTEVWVAGGCVDGIAVDIGAFGAETVDVGWGMTAVVTAGCSAGAVCCTT